jgi:hypothetical protein
MIVSIDDYQIVTAEVTLVTMLEPNLGVLTMMMMALTQLCILSHNDV